MSVGGERRTDSDLASILERLYWVGVRRVTAKPGLPTSPGDATAGGKSELGYGLVQALEAAILTAAGCNR